MKIIGALIVICALLAGVVPQFTDCESHGKAIDLGDGYTLPMKCHWTARSEVAAAAPLLAAGLFLIFGKHRETRRYAAAIGVVSGVMIIILPTLLIGVCAKEDMICAAVMKPTLVLTGSLVTSLGVIGIAVGSRRSRCDSYEKTQQKQKRREQSPTSSL